MIPLTATTLKGTWSTLLLPLDENEAIRWGRSILKEPEIALAQEAQILEVFKSALEPIRGRFSNTAIDKALAAAGGWADGSPTARWPLASIPQSEVDRLSKTFRKALPFLFNETGSSA